MPTPRSETLPPVRVTAEERDQLARLVDATGLPASAIVRAGLRAVIADPQLVLGASLALRGAGGESPRPLSKAAQRRQKKRR